MAPSCSLTAFITLCRLTGAVSDLLQIDALGQSAGQNERQVL
jgi:hypothetical protein